MSDEMPIARAKAGPPARSDHVDLDNAYALLASRFPAESFSRDFIFGSTRSTRLQAGFLAAVVAIFIVTIAHEIISAQRTSGQVATSRVDLPPEALPESVTAILHSRTAPADTAVRPHPSLADDPVRFVREVQRELKRVGCYSQEIDGEWGPATRRAMKDFTDRANAVLPLERLACPPPKSEKDHVRQYLPRWAEPHQRQPLPTECATNNVATIDGDSEYRDANRHQSGSPRAPTLKQLWIWNLWPIRLVKPGTLRLARTH
jgi:Putative peptidoglycan binding domain